MRPLVHKFTYAWLIACTKGQQSVLTRPTRDLPVGKHESIAVIPLGTLRVGVEEAGRECERAGPLRDRKAAYRVNSTCAAGAMPMGAPGSDFQYAGDGGGTRKGRTWMTGVGLADGVGGEGADGRDGDAVGGVGRKSSHCGDCGGGLGRRRAGRSCSQGRDDVH